MEVLSVDNKIMTVNGKLAKAPSTTGTGDMKKSVYDPTGIVEAAGGIPDYVESSAPVTSVNSKTGAVQLNASDVGALPDTTVIPTKTSQLDNDSGFITELPIASTTQIGGVKVGAGLSVTENGVLSATGGGTADSVEWNNVLDKPTTIAGYGITDAKIENGTITLGNQTITPLTSAPVTSVNSKTGAVVLTANDVGAATTNDIHTAINRTTAVNEADTNYTTLMARGEKLMAKAAFDAVTDWSTELVNGAIAWGYE